MYDGKAITAITKDYLKKYHKADDDDSNKLVIDEDYDEFYFDNRNNVDTETVHDGDTQVESDDTYFDYDNLDESDYDFAEEKLPKTIGSQQCHICLKHMSHFNNQYIWDEKVKIPEVLKHGICPLHCKIRSMQWLFGVGVKMRAAKDTDSNFDCDNLEESEFALFEEDTNAKEKEKEAKENTKDNEKEAKHFLQKQFVDEIGIRIDFVKQGKGTSTNGNAASRFFEEAEKTADILKIDVKIIKGFEKQLAKLNSVTEIHDPEIPKSSLKTLFSSWDILAICPQVSTGSLFIDISA